MQNTLNINHTPDSITTRIENGVRWETAEFWTSGQRRGHSLHEISYRACFKPQLPEYFIERYTKPGDLVADPFMGRGTTPLQAHLMGRRAAGSDANPLCVMMARPRFNPPTLHEIAERLRTALSLEQTDIPKPDEPLLTFYHPKTLTQLIALKAWFAERKENRLFDNVDDWIRMICLNRLTGHSSGFFSVRTMPPNQAISVEAQLRINQKNDQTPEPRDAHAIVMKKSRSLLRSGHPQPVSDSPVIQCTPSHDLQHLQDQSVSLIVTSPPFLDIVDYRSDHWLRCWFADIDPNRLDLDIHTSIHEWRLFITRTLAELARVIHAQGRIAFEVGEVRKAALTLEQEVIHAMQGLPLSLERVLINQQSFTKTSNIWGIHNNQRGTNTNRIVIMKRNDD